MIYLLLLLSQSDIQNIKYIGNREYIPNLVETINKAQHTIYIVMYSAGYYPTHPEGPDRKVYGAMFDAVKRGVRVKIILDASDWNPNNTRKNEITANYLKEGGVEVYWDPPEITTHSKIVIVDTLLCIVGSTNWTYYAFAHNNESSLLIESRTLAERLTQFFTDLLRVSTKELPINLGKAQ